jgi:uncharacterized protein YjiS (DUF1127 family)
MVRSSRRKRVEFKMTTITYGRETVRNPALRGDIMARVRDFMSRTRAERQLLQLYDRMLADIGVKRGEITSRVWG